MSADEDVVVEGRIEGVMSLTGALTVAKTGVVEADVRADSVTVQGRVLGNVTAAQRVEILAAGLLEGNIKSPKISIHEGAQFKGNVDMSGSGTPAAGESAPSSSKG